MDVMDWMIDARALPTGDVCIGRFVGCPNVVNAKTGEVYKGLFRVVLDVSVGDGDWGYEATRELSVSSRDSETGGPSAGWQSLQTVRPRPGDLLACSYSTRTVTKQTEDGKQRTYRNHDLTRIVVLLRAPAGVGDGVTQGAGAGGGVSAGGK